MTDGGIWILAMVLMIGDKEIIVKEYGIFDSHVVCESYRPEFEKRLRVPMACITVGDA